MFLLVGRTYGVRFDVWVGAGGSNKNICRKEVKCVWRLSWLHFESLGAGENIFQPKREFAKAVGRTRGRWGEERGSCESKSSAVRGKNAFFKAFLALSWSFENDSGVGVEVGVE